MRRTWVFKFPVPHFPGLAFHLARTPSWVLRDFLRVFTCFVLRKLLAHSPAFLSDAALGSGAGRAGGSCHPEASPTATLSSFPRGCGLLHNQTGGRPSGPDVVLRLG